jgi:hypothetical protein
VNHLPRAWAGPGKRPGMGVPGGVQVNSIFWLPWSVAILPGFLSLPHPSRAAML